MEMSDAKSGHVNSTDHAGAHVTCAASSNRRCWYASARRPAHGYELLEDLRASSAPGCCDPGMVYRTLRRFEHHGLVRSTWNTESGGPARRVYQ